MESRLSKTLSWLAAIIFVGTVFALSKSFQALMGLFALAIFVVLFGGP